MPLDVWFEASSTWLCDKMHKKEIEDALSKLSPGSAEQLEEFKRNLLATLEPKSRFSSQTLDIVISERIRTWVAKQKLSHLLELFEETEKPRQLQELHDKFPEYSEEELEFFVRHHAKIKGILEKSPYFTKKAEKECPTKVLKKYWAQIKRVLDSDHRLRLFELFRSLKQNGLDEKAIIDELKEDFPEIATIPTQFVLNYELHLQERSEKEFFFKFLKEEDLSDEEIYERLKERFPTLEKDEIGLFNKVYAIDMKNLLVSIIQELKENDLSDREILSSLYFEFPFLTHSELQETVTEVKFLPS